MKEAVIAHLRENRDQYVEELKDFLKLPSISADSAHHEDVRETAVWLKAALTSAGMDKVEVIETDKHPLVYAEWLRAGEEAETILIYGHYDVQPVDPLDLWETPPFEPSIRDGKLYARGASDDKGQTLMHIKAVQAMLEVEGKLPFNVKFLIEGEEEIGSPSLDAFVESEKEKLAADVLIISDTPMLSAGRPAICTGLRGIAALQIDVRGTKGDLHSGLYGGAVQNALHALVQLLASFRDEQGRIQVAGFYDGIEALPEAEKDSLAALGSGDEEMKEETGVRELFGEAGYTSRERTWTRPTLELNGVYGGFQGEGVKTVIPATAHAKLTCRLVPGQDPTDIFEKIEAHIAAHTPPGVTITTERHDSGKPFAAPVTDRAFQAAAQAYADVYNTEVAYTRMGGSIPVVETFDAALGVPIVLMGFGLPSENFHAPNEHFHLDNFDKGLETIVAFWAHYAQKG
ncbi:dipeptidase [Shouchella lonarensis]|uniref:Acetylornithine deacetylase/Succinyl-diaminopimelate desuccinylase n=1 Tax=Shouchella lonarensis TaxID=1464122 RepID=A0A1G6GTY8_9BACI|nr:dipeptidase [Shouchella lonarensis]SDB85418.1 Acetylornithine deacetylase/Succinyl-diaminopimelate desuccinylase [Shouchella lonarensis]